MKAHAAGGSTGAWHICCSYVSRTGAKGSLGLNAKPTSQQQFRAVRQTCKICTTSTPAPHSAPHTAHTPPSFSKGAVHTLGSALEGTAGGVSARVLTWVLMWRVSWGVGESQDRARGAHSQMIC